MCCYLAQSVGVLLQGSEPMEILVLCVPLCWWGLLRTHQNSHHPPCVLWNGWTGSAGGGGFSARNPCSGRALPLPLLLAEERQP